VKIVCCQHMAPEAYSISVARSLDKDLVDTKFSCETSRCYCGWGKGAGLNLPFVYSYSLLPDPPQQGEKVCQSTSSPSKFGRSNCACSFGIPLFLLLVFATLSGCQKPAAKTTATVLPPPEVLIVSPIERKFTSYEEFTGRLEASDVIEIRARVGGYLEKILFTEGAEVKQGDLLAEIDARTYEAEVARTLATLEQAKSRLDRMSRQLDRGRQLIESKVVTAEDFDLMQFDHNEAVAVHQAAQASHRLAELDLEFTKIKSPIDGRIGRRLIDPGNLVKTDDSVLAIIGSVRPIYAYFEIDERTVLRLRDLILKGEMKLPAEQKIEVLISLANESDFQLKGTINFTDNSLDPHTGTLRARARIDNDNLLLIPGLIVRCRMPIGNPQSGLFIPEESLGSDQGQRYLCVLNDKDEVVYRRVTVGMSLSGWRNVSGELFAEDRVIVSGLQRVRPGQMVIAKPGESLVKVPPESEPVKQVQDPRPIKTGPDQAG